MLTAFWNWFVPFACGGIVTLIGAGFAFVKKERKRERTVENGVQCLLRAEIIRQYEKWTDRGFCPLYAKEALKREYDSYHELGGNDVATALYHTVMDLPTEPQKTEQTEGSLY